MRRLGRFIPSLKDRRWERIILLVALLNGLLYLGLVPPWQHYDEPTHFEYAWLIAERGTLPETGDYDPEMRREVAASMIEHDFFRDMGFRPNLLLEDKPTWIGLSELGHPPFYYLLVALPLRLIRYADVTVQLYVARGVSLLLYLLSVWLAGRIVAELVEEGHVLRWAVPGMMALLPAYTDLMTAVNNDAAAVATFTLFLWGAVRTIRRGLCWTRLAWVVGAAALCAWTKNTAMAAMLLAPLALLLALGERRRRLIWAGLLGLGLALTVAVVGWGDAAFWYRQTGQTGPTLEKREEAPLGEAVLAIEMTVGEPRQRLRQPILEADVEALQGRTVTLGAWIWASAPVQVRSPMLDDGRQTTWEPVEVGTTPAFYAITATIAAEAKQVYVVVQPSPERTAEEAATVYYDGVTLAEGARPPDRPPLFQDPEGAEGTWGGAPLDNRLRNGSAEAAWPRIRPWVELGPGRVFSRVSTLPRRLVGLLDWSYTGGVYGGALTNMFQSFWARFGWNHVRLAPAWYSGLAAWTAIGLLGAIMGLVRMGRQSIRALGRGLALLALTGLMVWGFCFLRTDYFRPFLPGARYAYPAIVPTVLALMAGWLAWAPRRARGWVALGLLSAMVLLDVVSLITIWRFY